MVRGGSVVNDYLHFDSKKFDPLCRFKIIKSNVSHALGEKGSGLTQKSSNVQDFHKLRDECLQNGKLFEDPEFPCGSSSLYFKKTQPKFIKWLRPSEICSNPEFITEGASRFDVVQGQLGDCWVLAAIGNLTLNKTLFAQVVPHDQSFQDDYAGIFHFRFWQYGRWVDVVIDDRLPTNEGEFYFLRSSEPNEFWSSLLEKAYAKLYGCYEALVGGSTSEAMGDFTGGVTISIDLKERPENLWQILLKCYERDSLMGASVKPNSNVLEEVTAKGLVRGHAYSLTRIDSVQTSAVSKGEKQLIRLRNPWGNATEWTGTWSDSCVEWKSIPDEEKDRLGLTFDKDGEFWMSYQDFVKNFDSLEICLLNSDDLLEELQANRPKKWEVNVFEGEWVRGVTAGGCLNSLKTFHHNPQYRITLDEVDNEDDDGKCTVIVALMQKNRRAMRKVGAENLPIGFTAFKLENPDLLPKPLDSEFFKTNLPTARCTFTNSREVSQRCKLPPGSYCIVPSTFDPNEQGKFLLRVFSEHNNNLEEQDEEIHTSEIDNRVKEKLDPEQGENDETLEEFFEKIAGEDMKLDWMELKEVLDLAEKNNPTLQYGFSKDICRNMICMMDLDGSGKLGLEDFKLLWTQVKLWQRVFKLYDPENGGYLSPFELREALASAGYHLNAHILNVLSRRYASRDGRIALDDFIMCAIRLKSMMEIFQKQAGGSEKSVATFKLDEWIETILYS